MSFGEPKRRLRSLDRGPWATEIEGSVGDFMAGKLARDAGRYNLGSSGPAG